LDGSLQQITRLDNGLRVVSVDMPWATSVCLGLWVAVGSRHEIADRNGAAHFIEHMLFKGTANRSARRIVAEVEGLGGYLNAYTSEDHTCYYARARADRWRTLLDVLWDMYSGAIFPAAELEREREVILEERAMYLDDPHHLNQELLDRAMWPEHPLGRPIEGTEASLWRLGRRELKRFQAQHYLADNTFVVAAGRVEHARLVALVKRLSREIPRGRPPGFEPAISRQSAPRVVVERRDVDQTQLALGIRTCGRGDRRRHAVRMLSGLLAENMSSRLYQVLRERHGLAYSVNSTPSTFADTGDLTITAGVDSERLPRALELLRKELRRVRDKAPSAAELRAAKDYVLGQFEIFLESNENYMTWLGESVTGHGRIASPATVKRRIRRVSPAEVRAVAAEFLRPENLTLSLVTPCKSRRGLVEYLKL